MAKSKLASINQLERFDDADSLRQRIVERAYWRAEQRGFEPGHDLEDWLAAEAEVRAALANSEHRGSDE